MAEALIIVALFTVVGALVALDAWLTRRRIARARADAAWAATVRDHMARGARRRPKVDRKIQRRRYAR